MLSPHRFAPAGLGSGRVSRLLKLINPTYTTPYYRHKTGEAYSKFWKGSAGLSTVCLHIEWHTDIMECAVIPVATKTANAVNTRTGVLIVSRTCYVHPFFWLAVFGQPQGPNARWHIWNGLCARSNCQIISAGYVPTISAWPNGNFQVSPAISPIFTHGTLIHLEACLKLAVEHRTAPVVLLFQKCFGRSGTGGFNFKAPPLDIGSWPIMRLLHGFEEQCGWVVHSTYQPQKIRPNLSILPVFV